MRRSAGQVWRVPNSGVSVPEELGASVPLPPGRWTTCSPAQKLPKPVP